MKPCFVMHITIIQIMHAYITYIGCMYAYVGCNLKCKYAARIFFQSSKLILLNFSFRMLKSSAVFLFYFRQQTNVTIVAIQV